MTFHPCICALALALLAGGARAQDTYAVDIAGPLDELFIGEGWYGREGPYTQFGPIWRSPCRWARQGATVALPVFPGVPNTIEMRAEVRGDEHQRMRWFIDGRLAAEMPISPDLHYRQELPAELFPEGWAELRIETLTAHPVPGDNRDLRVAVDWIRVSGDGPARAFLSEALARRGQECGLLAREQAPDTWRFRHDPNNIGDTYTPHKFYDPTYDDSAFEVVPTDHAPPMLRGDAAWYRVWLLLEERLEEVRAALRLPGADFAGEGHRVVWINGLKLEGAEDEDLERRAAEALAHGFNHIVVKVMQGPLPRPSGDALVLPPAHSGRWSPEGVHFRPGPLALTPEFAGANVLGVMLLSPGGEVVGSARGRVTDLGEGRRGIDPAVEWPLSEYGEHTLVVVDGADHAARFPVHFLGIHMFHWGWYQAAGGTTWRGFQAGSNDYLDQLFERLEDWGRPHHSISWGGAILTPGTGFHRTERVDYIAKHREAIAAGLLDFVGMPFPPRNICTDFGESLLRSMRLSREMYRTQLGVEPRRFYSHDATMTPLMPQIMQIAGYDTYCIAENWWGQGRSIPNSRDCYFRNEDGTEVRILDSWYHGISPVTAARRAVQQGKPAVLCNEEFACLDRTVFLEQEHLDTLAAEGIFLRPVSLDEYQLITEAFARELVYQGDHALCFKGWTGGGEGEFEYEKANRALETRLVALENLVAHARALGMAVDQQPIAALWELSFRRHDCHTHWRNAHPDWTRQLREAVADTDSRMGQVAEVIAGRIAAAADGVVVFNPLGFRRDVLARVDAPAGTRSLRAAGEAFPLQPDPDHEGAHLASLPGLPSCGYRHYAFSPEPPDASQVTATRQPDGAVTLNNGEVTLTVLPIGEIAALREADGLRAVTTLNRLHLARAEGRSPQEPLSTEASPLNLAHYLPAQARGEVRVVCEGPVMAAVECDLIAPDYPQVSLTMRVSLVAGERMARVRLVMDFPEPTVVKPGEAGGPHEGVYFPGIFVDFPMPAAAQPAADMAYCLTDGVLTSTNHETFMRQPFRNGTFNTLTLAGPNSGEYFVLTRGLPDFFVVARPESRLGMSLGIGAEGCPYSGAYVHEYAVFMPAAGDPAAAQAEAYLAAHGFQVDAPAVRREQGPGDLAAEGSLVSVQGEGVMIPGVQLLDGELAVRVVNLLPRATQVQLRAAVDPAGATVAPAGVLDRDALVLGPRAVRELRAPVGGAPAP